MNTGVSPASVSKSTLSWTEGLSQPGRSTREQASQIGSSHESAQVSAGVTALLASLIKNYKNYDSTFIPVLPDKKSYALKEILDSEVDSVSIFSVTPISENRFIVNHDDQSYLWMKRGNTWRGKWLDEGTKVVTLQMALPDGRFVVGYHDGSLTLWSPHGTSSQELLAHNGPVNVLQTLPEGKFISGGEDGKLCVWSEKEGVWTHKIQYQAPCSIVCGKSRFDGSFVVGGDDGVARIISTAINGELPVTELGEPKKDSGRYFFDIGVFPSGAILLRTSNSDRLWRSTEAGWQAVDVPIVDRCAEALPDDRIFCHGSGKLSFLQQHADGSWKREPIVEMEEVFCAKVLPGGTKVLAGYKNGAINLLTRESEGNWKQQALRRPNYESVEEVSYLSNGDLLSCGGGQIIIWS